MTFTKEYLKEEVERELVEQAANNKIRQIEEEQRRIINEMLNRKKELEIAIIDIENVLLTHKGSSEEKINKIEKIINKIKWVDIDNTPH